MSLLLQALQRAAKSREVTGQEPETAAPRLELEPQPGEPQDGPAAAALTFDDLEPSPPQRRTVAPPPSYLGAAEYGNPSALDYVRERPVVAFGAFAVLFAVCYGIYLYVQIFHPGWLRGEFGQSTAVAVAVPPPAHPQSAPQAGEFNLPPVPGTPPATNYPTAGMSTVPQAATTPSTGTAPPGTSTLPSTATPGTAPMPLPGMATGNAPAVAPAAGTPQSAELANLMNLPARPSAAPAPAPSRLSTLGDALTNGPATAGPAPSATAPKAAIAPAPAPAPAPSPVRAREPLPPSAAAPRTPSASAAGAPASPQRQASAARANPVSGAKPLSQAQSGAGIIELKDQVVVNAAPAQQIEAATVADAYRAWRAGRLDQARETYRDVLANEPKNVDALLGLAGIAQQQGNSQEALSFFGRALELDPRNSSAQAGIIAMTGQSDPGASEARLKQLIARDPSAFLHFTLGNLYARQNQWSQAQQSYFQAYSMNADNSDYAYNLAVSLEHIGQDKLAITYYRKAVDLSLKQGGRASFNQEQVIDRIAKLSLRAR